MKKMMQSLSVLMLFSGAAFAQQRELAEKLETPQAVESVGGNTLKSERREAAEKYQEELIGLMKSSGFEGEQIEKYLEISKKAESQLEDMQREGQMKEAEMGMQKKKVYLNLEEELKKIFGDERYEKFLEIRRQVYGNE